MVFVVAEVVEDMVVGLAGGTAAVSVGDMVGVVGIFVVVDIQNHIVGVMGL
jgi:hypothetical protein